MKLQQSAQQKQAMLPSAQLILSTSILRMSMEDLLTYVREAAEENPLIELVSREAPSHRFEGVRSRGAAHSAPDHGAAEIAANADTLQEALLFQLAPLRLKRPLHAYARCIIELLDDRGYLPYPLEQVSTMLGDADHRAVKRALAVIQQLEPCGVGARSLRECLLLQLRKNYPEDGCAAQIVREHLDALGKKQYAAIARALGVETAQVQQSARHICALNPIPGNGFSANNPIGYIVPDLILQKSGGHYELAYNDAFIPTLHIDEHYAKHIGNADEAARTYLKERQVQAQFVKKSIERRRDTLMAIAAAILQRQSSFFKEGPTALRPLLLSEIADDTQMHVSTVSRCVNGKYLESPWGTLELRTFFCRGVATASGEAASRERILRVIEAMIEGENPRKPLSDDAIAQKLKEQGILLSRRCVNKYRDMLHIPASSARRFPRG